MEGYSTICSHHQWFVDQNHGIEADLRASGNEYLTHWVDCRKMKERFSDTMARDRAAHFQYAAIGNDRGLKDATWSAI